MCQEAYARPDQTAWFFTHRCRQKKIVSRVAGRVYVIWQHQASVLSKSHGVLLMMRGSAESNARKTVGREYPERHATCAEEVMLRRQAIQL